jgi:hypothetical protein
MSGGLSRPDAALLETGPEPAAEAAVGASVLSLAALIAGSKTAGDLFSWPAGAERSMSGAWPANRHPKNMAATCMAIDSAAVQLA